MKKTASKSSSQRLARLLFEAAVKGDKQECRKLLRQGAAPNFFKDSGFYALHMATLRNDIELARLLIDAGALLEAKDFAGHTPLALCSAIPGAQMAKELLRAGADINAQNMAKTTPLMLAAGMGQIELLNALLNHQEGWKTKSRQIKRALALAKREKREDSAQALCSWELAMKEKKQLEAQMNDRAKKKTIQARPRARL